jgi:predicted secreted Zn-dependent protease
MMEVAVSGTMALVIALLIPADVLDEGLVVKQEEKYYDVTGTTAKELQAATRHLGGLHSAGTQWSVGVEFHWVSNGSECSVASVSTKVDITVTLPRWTNASVAPDALRLRWALGLRDLRLHEQVHVDNAISTAKAIHKAVRELRPAADCQTLDGDVHRTEKTLVEEALRRDDSYDLRTAHGIIP